jgi:hypothetical protein
MVVDADVTDDGEVEPKGGRFVPPSATGWKQAPGHARFKGALTVVVPLILKDPAASTGQLPWPGYYLRRSGPTGSSP